MHYPHIALLLADGIYRGNGSSVLKIIGKDITVRASSPGMAILDGQSARRVPLGVQTERVARIGRRARMRDNRPCVHAQERQAKCSARVVRF